MVSRKCAESCIRPAVALRCIVERFLVAVLMHALPVLVKRREVTCGWQYSIWHFGIHEARLLRLACSGWCGPFLNRAPMTGADTIVAAKSLIAKSGYEHFEHLSRGMAVR